jgi:hypothetical protein
VEPQRFAITEIFGAALQASAPGRKIHLEFRKNSIFRSTNVEFKFKLTFFMYVAYTKFLFMP